MLSGTDFAISPLPMANDALHESPSDLSTATREMHRALASLIEELEAIDWYAQRIDACGDAELRDVLVHNRDEEKEHACMTLEWICRRDATFAALLRRFLGRGRQSHADPTLAGGSHGSDVALGIGALRSNGRDEEEDRP